MVDFFRGGSNYSLEFSPSPEMDDKVKLVVHGRRGYFLVVKKNQKKFCLPSGGVRRNEDFMDVAHKLLNKVV